MDQDSFDPSPGLEERLEVGGACSDVIVRILSLLAFNHEPLHSGLTCGGDDLRPVLHVAQRTGGAGAVRLCMHPRNAPGKRGNPRWGVVPALRNGADVQLKIDTGICLQDVRRIFAL